MNLTFTLYNNIDTLNTISIYLLVVLAVLLVNTGTNSLELNNVVLAKREREDEDTDSYRKRARIGSDNLNENNHSTTLPDNTSYPHSLSPLPSLEDNNKEPVGEELNGNLPNSSNSDHDSQASQESNMEIASISVNNSSLSNQTDNHNTPFDDEEIDDPNMLASVQLSIIEGYNNADLTEQVHVIDLLINSYYSIDYSTLSNEVKQNIANDIRLLALRYEELGGTIEELQLSGNVFDDYVLDLLRESLGTAVDQWSDSDDEGPEDPNGSDSNGSDSFGGGDSNLGSGPNSPNSNSNSFTNENSNNSIIERLVVGLLIFLNEIIDKLCEIINYF